MKDLRKLLVIALAGSFFMPAFQSCKKGEEDPGLSLRSRTGRLAGEWTLDSYNQSLEETREWDDPIQSSPGDNVKEEINMSSSWDGSSYESNETTTTTDDNGNVETVESSMSGGDGTSSGTTTSTINFEYTYSLNHSITIERDGTFEYTWEEVTSRTDTSSGTGYKLENVETTTTKRSRSGTWAWLGKDKEKDIADKQRVAFWFDSFDDEEVEEEEETYTDTDADDGFDYTTNNSTSTTRIEITDTRSETHPDMVWNLVKLANKELQAEYESSSLETEVVTRSSTNSTTVRTDESSTNSTSSGTYNFTQE